ncbi:MAG: hypothetical protein WA578_15645, partial [Candidatus Sulfotelmatobacter sp.]
LRAEEPAPSLSKGPMQLAVAMIADCILQIMELQNITAGRIIKTYDSRPFVLLDTGAGSASRRRRAISAPRRHRGGF